MDYKQIVTIVLALGLVITALGIVSQAGLGNTPQNTLTVSGMAELSVEPDKATMFIAVETTQDTARESQAQNTQMANAVIAALKAAGIRDDQIQTESFTISPRERYDPRDGNVSLEGYTVTHMLKVEINDTTNVGRYIDASVEAGANRVDRIEFSLSDEKEAEVMEELLALAGADAKRKAEALAAGMDVNLGRIVAVTESQFNIPPVPYYMAREGAALDQAESTQITPREVMTTSTVSVIYRI